MARTPNAFVLFKKAAYQEEREKNPALSNQRLFQLLADRWRSMPERMKAGYQERAEELRVEDREAKDRRRREAEEAERREKEAEDGRMTLEGDEDDDDDDDDT